jgi:hypothetical protein
MKPFVIILILMLTLTACGGGGDEQVMPTSVVIPGESDTEADEAVEEAEEASNVDPVDLMTDSSITDFDPASLESNTFKIEVTNNKGEKIMLEPFMADDENAKLLYVNSGYSVMDYMDPPFRQMDFTRVTRDNPENPDSGMTSSDIKIQLPMDVQPGTYDINSMAPNLDDASVYGAWISIFDGEYAIYDQYEGTITISEISDESVSGNFAVTGRDEFGNVSTAVGVFNGITQRSLIQ